MSSGTSGAQDWRAIACLAPNGERLLCVGESSSQVRAAYAGAWGEVIRDEDRPTVRAISLQRWSGQFWSGQWEHQTYLAVPATRNGKASDADAELDADADAELGTEAEAQADVEGELEADVDGGVAVAVEEIDAIDESASDDLLETDGTTAQNN